MNGIREELEKGYQALFTRFHLDPPLDANNIGLIIRQSLKAFLEHAKRPAVYCYGGHTKMLMADYMHELKNVKYIVDNYAAPEGEHLGFRLIKDEEMEASGIDAVVLSSYKFRKDLKQKLKESHPKMPVLDIYDEFEKKGIRVQADYYYSNHPYQHYKRINQLQREIRDCDRESVLKDLYKDLITKYIHIKDFRTAIGKLEEWKGHRAFHPETGDQTEELLAAVNDLYALQKKAAAALSENHVLLFCLDGLRRQDLSERTMPKLKRLLDETGYQFTNAYSFSTSTFESLVPAYSENGDLRTGYYEKNSVSEEECRFASFAEKQGRGFYIYGDGEHYIEGAHIHYRDQFSTVTEKLWQFLLDASETERDLFYLHEIYESHFTFSNPYTETALISEGTAMLFDFLPVKGGRLRADYARQHEDAIRYMDDVVEPILRPMRCRMVLYADHGNLILDYNTSLSEIGSMEYTCSEGWTGIPLAIRSREMGTGKDNRLISLLEFNPIVISLLSGTPYQAPDCDYIKMARSELYNPDFRLLYRMIGKERYLQAFECFLFAEGRKLMVYADGTTQLYQADDTEIFDTEAEGALLENVKKDITVY